VQRQKGGIDWSRPGVIGVFTTEPFELCSPLTCKEVLHRAKNEKYYVHMGKNLQLVGWGDFVSSFPLDHTGASDPPPPLFT